MVEIDHLPEVPDDLRGRATLHAHLSALDPAGDRVEGTASVLLSEDAIEVAAITELEPEQREVFLMREFLDMPFKQIAEVVGAAENTVKSRMRYALEKLRLELDDYKEMAKAMP